jgi:hypothetical protein
MSGMKKIKITLKAIYEAPSGKRFYQIVKLSGVMSVLIGNKGFYHGDVVTPPEATTLSNTYHVTVIS